MYGKPTEPAQVPPLRAEKYDHWTQQVLRHRDLDRMRHVNNVSTIGLYEDGWARFVDDGCLGRDDTIEWHVEYLGIDFRKELYYRDDVRVGTRVTGGEGGRLHIGQTLFRDSAPVGGTERIVVPIDRLSGRPARLTDAALDLARKATARASPPGPFRPAIDAPPQEAETEFPVWREDIFRFADLDIDQRIGRLAQLELIESGRIALIQDVGPPTPDPDHIWLAVHVALNFLCWPDYPGQARTGTKVTGFGRSSCHIGQTIFSGGRAIATGGAVVALANRKTFETVEIPGQLRRRLANAPAGNLPPSQRYNPVRRAGAHPALIPPK